MSKLADTILNKIIEHKGFDVMFRECYIREGMKALRTHFGAGIVITSAKVKHKRDVSEDKLRKGEVSAVTYTVGNYAIRESVMLYKDDVNNDYLMKIPAEKEQVEKFREEYGEGSIIFIDLDGCRPVTEIHVANLNDDEPKWRYVCCATSAKSLAWSESIDFIGTVKKNIFAPDRKNNLFVLVNYMGDSFSTETWHRLTYKGELKEYKVHPYDVGADERAWKW